MQRYFPRFAIALLAIFMACLPAAGQEQAPRAVVERFHAALLDTMKRAESLGIKGRYRDLEPAIENSFHLRLMVAIASGRHWRKAGRAERDRLTQAFRRFSVATYASRFSSFSGESFETANIASGPRKTVLVNTRLKRVSDSPVQITYVVKKFAARWRIVDVVVDGGVSELAVRRSEYAATLKRGGVAALITALNKKADRLIAE